MKKFLVLASLFVSVSTASAATTPAPLCVDVDKDKSFAVVPCTQLNGLETPPAAKADCNDNDPAVHPGAREILGDAIDQDCDGTIDPFVSDAYKAFGCSKTDAKCQKHVDAENALCNAATGQCSISWSNGKYVITPGSFQCDTNCDGVREILDQAKYDKYKAELKDGQHQCRTTAKPNCDPRSSGKGCSKHSGGHTGSSSSAKVIVKIDTKLIDAESKTRKTEDDKLGKRLDDEDDLIGDLDTRTEDLEKGLKSEAETRAAADKELGEGVTKAQATADKAHKLASKAGKLALKASDDASEANTNGVDYGLDVGVAVKAQNSLTMKGDGTARGSVAPTLLALAHVGAETKGGLYRFTGGVGLPWETSGPSGSTEMKKGFMWLAGVEALAKVNATSAVGASLSYIDHESAGTVAANQTKSRGAFLALVWQFSPELLPGATRFNAVKLSLGVGVESFGTKTDPVWNSTSQTFDHNESVNTGLAGMFTITTGLGMGSSER